MGMAWDFGHSLVTLILFLFSSFLHQLFTTPDSVEKGWASNAQCAQTWKKNLPGSGQMVQKRLHRARGGGRGEGEDATLRVRPMAILGTSLLHPTRARPVHTPQSWVSAQIAWSRLKNFFHFWPFWAHCAPGGQIGGQLKRRPTICPPSGQIVGRLDRPPPICPPGGQIVRRVYKRPPICPPRAKKVIFSGQIDNLPTMKKRSPICPLNDHQFAHSEDCLE